MRLVEHGASIARRSVPAFPLPSIGVENKVSFPRCAFAQSKAFWAAEYAAHLKLRASDGPFLILHWFFFPSLVHTSFVALLSMIGFDREREHGDHASSATVRLMSALSFEGPLPAA